GAPCSPRGGGGSGAHPPARRGVVVAGLEVRRLFLPAAVEDGVAARRKATAGRQVQQGRGLTLDRRQTLLLAVQAGHRIDQPDRVPVGGGGGELAAAGRRAAF